MNVSTYPMSPRNVSVTSTLTALMMISTLTTAIALEAEQPSSPTIHLAAFGTSHKNKSETSAPETGRLADFLIGTKWLMYEIPGRIVEFRPNGKFELEDWERQGIEARWKVTGPKQITVTVISQKFRNLTAVLNLDDRLSYFTGTDLGGKRQITKSPRINSVPNDPADPYRR